MTLAPGTRLGPYEIAVPIGAGGMGEVYRAKDTTLGRDVAVKVLPAAFAKDHDRVARFRREAQVLATFNHPNIASIHGFEETEEGVALALELVEGEDLRVSRHEGLCHDVGRGPRRPLRAAVRPRAGPRGLAGVVYGQ